MTHSYNGSITLSPAADVRYLLRIGDICLIHAQRLGEWCGHAPVLEEDLALTNLSLDLIGQARAIFTRAGALEAKHGIEGRDEDQYAFLRDERDYLNPTLAELPMRRGGADFADTQARNLVLATLMKLLWTRLTQSSDAGLAGIAAKSLKEARYHQQHAADWVKRLGDGTGESAQRMQAAVDRLWPYVPELFESDAIEDAAAASGLGPRLAELQADWQAEIAAVFAQAGLTVPKTGVARFAGKRGIHSEHMGVLLAEMQYLQRAYPGGAW
jgi:ring-1,2-phenylacetyl-CoA epoxidase subunit PaaC